MAASSKKPKGVEFEITTTPEFTPEQSQVAWENAEFRMEELNKVLAGMNGLLSLQRDFSDTQFRLSGELLNEAMTAYFIHLRPAVTAFCASTQAADEIAMSLDTEDES